MRIALNIVLFLAVLLLIGTNIAIRPDNAKLNYEFLPQMAHSPRYNAFAPNPNFPDDKTLQAPPPGSIPRGYTPLHYAAIAQDALRAGEELKSPVDSGSQQARERGAFVFANFCAVCHGFGGLGNGTVTQRGFPPPPSLLAKRALEMKDGQMFHVLTFGQNNMPSYASQLSRQDRWNVIAHLRMLQSAAAPQLNMKAVATASSVTSAPAGGGE